MRLATWNTQWRFRDWEPRQPMIEATLAGHEPDVVLLQETWPEQAARLGAACGLEVLGFGGGFFDQDLSSVPNDEQFGNAVLARSGELVINEPFDSPGDPAPRQLVAALVDGVVVASVHLSHLSEKGGTRGQQLTEIVDLLAATERPFVIAGDCNLVPSSEEYRTAQQLGLVDTWAALHPADHGPTMVPANPQVTHTDWMNERNGSAVPKDTGVRLDYVWASTADLVTSIDRFGQGKPRRWPSDHLGLVADLVTDNRVAGPSS